MQTLNALFLGLVIVPIIAPLSGTADSSEEDGGFLPQRDGSIKWIANSMLHNVMREVMKSFHPVEEINFYLYTRANPRIPEELFVDDVDSVKESLFNYQHPTRIIIHGWMSNSDLDINTLIRDAYLKVGPHNIISVDWVRKSVNLYPDAVLNVPKIGDRVAQLIDFMSKNGFIKPENLTLVGHSLGAHIAGIAARTQKSGQVHTIYGLDPASPMFPYNTSVYRLHVDDAYYVESIQTNSDISGYVEPIGKATFYPNGGRRQPGCGIDLTGGCAHFRSYKFFAEAIKMNGFPSIKCCTYQKATTKSCGDKFSTTVRMGAPGNADIASGFYYVPVGPSPPYAVQPDANGKLK